MELQARAPTQCKSHVPEISVRPVCRARPVTTSGSARYSGDGFHVAEVAATVLGSGKASRLYRSLVREKRVAKDVLTYLFPLQSGASLFLAWVTGFPGSDLAVPYFTA